MATRSDIRDRTIGATKSASDGRFVRQNGVIALGSIAQNVALDELNIGFV